MGKKGALSSFWTKFLLDQEEMEDAEDCETLARGDGD